MADGKVGNVQNIYRIIEIVARNLWHSLRTFTMPKIEGDFDFGNKKRFLLRIRYLNWFLFKKGREYFLVEF